MSYAEKIIASTPMIDVPLLQLEKMPRSAMVAKAGHSDSMEAGDENYDF
jgi:hypothetical protein